MVSQMPFLQRVFDVATLDIAQTIVCAVAAMSWAFLAFLAYAARQRPGAKTHVLFANLHWTLALGAACELIMMVVLSKVFDLNSLLPLALILIFIWRAIFYSLMTTTAIQRIQSMSGTASKRAKSLQFSIAVLFVCLLVATLLAQSFSPQVALVVRFISLLAIPAYAYVFLRELIEERLASAITVQHLTTELAKTGKKLFNEVSFHRKLEAALSEEEQRLKITLRSIGYAVITTDMTGSISYVNPIAERLIGWTNEEASGQPFQEVFKVFTEVTSAVSPIAMSLDTDETMRLTRRPMFIRRDGVRFPIEESSEPIVNLSGSKIGSVVVFRDVTDTHLMGQKLAYQAHHDFLTGLPNRLLLQDRMVQAIKYAQRQKCLMALLVLDLDHFKTINDSLGHGVGDKLLQQIAESLKTCVRASDTLCRHGGDEFIILLPIIDTIENAAEVARTILLSINKTYVIDGHQLKTSCSIGISLCPEHGIDVDSLTKSADMAMYQAKLNGRNNFAFCSEELNVQANERLMLENRMRRALEKGEFILHYQPKICLKTLTITGVEALIRWQDPALGIISPSTFITVAEETGLIVPIGKWVLYEACRQAKAWQADGVTAIRVAVNISAIQLRHKNFFADVLETLDATGLAPECLELELTESVLMRSHDAEKDVSLLVALKKLGIQFSIDDFGTGYSSLSYLKRFPIDTLKIDQSFVRDISTNPSDAAIVSAIVQMARVLNIRVLAEGVETKQQLAYLRSNSCDEVQGFYFSQPIEADKVVALFSANSVVTPIRRTRLRGHKK